MFSNLKSDLLSHLKNSELLELAFVYWVVGLVAPARCWAEVYEWPNRRDKDPILRKLDTALAKFFGYILWAWKDFVSIFKFLEDILYKKDKDLK